MLLRNPENKIHNAGLIWILLARKIILYYFNLLMPAGGPYGLF